MNTNTNTNTNSQTQPESREGIASVRGEGLPVVLIHGNGVDHRILLSLEPQLCTSGKLQRIYVDLPGFGGTKPLARPGGLPELADWLEATIRSQVGNQEFALIGNSMGGLLAQEMADRFASQICGMLLLASAIRPAAEERTLPERSLLSPDPDLLGSLRDQDALAYAEMSVIQSRANWERFEEFVLPGLRAANLRAMALLAKRYFLDPLPVDRTTQLDVPVLIISGLQDHVVGYQDAKALNHRYPNTRYLDIDQAGHNVHLDQPELVSQALGHWGNLILAQANNTSEPKR